MTIRWLTAFIDLSVDRFDVGTRFWQQATRWTMSPRRGERLEFATLLPDEGDAYLRVQQLETGDGGIHLDIHAEDVWQVVPDVQALGPTLCRTGGLP